MKKEGAEMKKQVRKEQQEYPTLYFHAPDMLLKEPVFQEAYVEAFWKPDRIPAVKYCENTTVYD